MTSLTTILTLTPPTLISRDMGSELQEPLALAIIGGMAMGTFVSLFIPLVYWYFYRRKSRYN